MQMHDIIVVGAGSAGCAIAARASEDPQRTVLLVEDGPDYADVATTPYDLVNSHNIEQSQRGHPGVQRRRHRSALPEIRRQRLSPLRHRQDGTRANTNLTCIMIGEKVGEWLRTRPALYGL